MIKQIFFDIARNIHVNLTKNKLLYFYKRKLLNFEKNAKNKLNKNMLKTFTLKKVDKINDCYLFVNMKFLIKSDEKFGIRNWIKLFSYFCSIFGI